MARRKRKHNAKFFRDKPRFKRGKERSMINVMEPWERQYAGIRKAPKRKRTAKRRKTKRSRKSFWRL